MNSKKSAWLLAARPKTLPASIGPVLLGASLVKLELLKQNAHIFILTLLCALLLQIATNLVNDYFDSQRGLDDHNRLGPERALQMGWLTPSELKKGFYLVFLIAILLGIFLMFKGGLPIVIIGILSVTTAYIYTGGPFPLSYFALGELLALIFFGPIPVWGTYYLLTNDFSYFPLFVGLIPGLIALSIMGINNLRDNINDKEKGKKTLATIFGEGFARYLIVIGSLIAVCLPIHFYLRLNNYIFLAPAVLFIVNFMNWHKILKGPIDQGLNKVLAQTGKFLFLVCLSTALGFLNL
jgi:1,4-dihydroxy-2-naphthoate octaprenyltransferase